MTNHSPERVSLWTLATAFLKLGTIAFGGPAAHIALMEEEFVRRRQWLTHQEFLDRLGAANLIPGPSSTEMAIYIGYTKRGWPGLIVAGCCFIIPAAILVCAIAAAYVRFGSMPRVGGILYALKPVVIAVVLQAFWKLARSAVKTAWLGALGIAAAALCFFQVDSLLILAGAGLLAGLPVLLGKFKSKSATTAALIWLKTSLPLRPRLSACGVYFSPSSRSAQYCLAAAMFCWRSCALTSFCACIGSRKNSCWIPWPSAR